MKCKFCKEKDAILACDRCHRTRYCGSVCKCSDLESHKNLCYIIDKKLLDNKDNWIFHQAFDLNLFSMFKLINYNAYKGNLNKVDGARYYLYKAVISMIMYDPVTAAMKITMSDNDHLYWHNIDLDIQRAYSLLSCNKSLFAEPLIWKYIPTYLHLDIKLRFKKIMQSK